MTDSAVLVPHLAWPLRLGVGNTFATVEQDSDDDIMQGVLVLLSTPLGRQIELPDYGMPDQTFSVTPDLDAAADAVAAWQPRATIDTSVQVDTFDELAQRVQIVVGNA
ncbi:MAG TPA: hypothetical protein VFT75_18290 [Nocardioidaceae bacterium]|nr:hypothetical protein [Nocardioidaceae bacterium]